jgi:hypothetical protein
LVAEEWVGGGMDGRYVRYGRIEGWVDGWMGGWVGREMMMKKVRGVYGFSSLMKQK